MTSKRRVFPYRSTTSRSDSRPSLQLVWTWKSQSRKGSYPGTSGPHILVRTVGRTMTQDLRPEVAHVETEHAAFAERQIAARRRPDPAVEADRNRTDRREPPAEIGVFAVELD